jgi:hypothetical protein
MLRGTLCGILVIYLYNLVEGVRYAEKRVRLEVIPAVLLKIQVAYDVTLFICNSYRRFGRSWYFSSFGSSTPSRATV